MKDNRRKLLFAFAFMLLVMVVHMVVIIFGADIFPVFKLNTINVTEFLEDAFITPKIVFPQEATDHCRQQCLCRFELSKTRLKCPQVSGNTSIRNFDEYICPQMFRNIADFVYAWEGGYHEESLRVPNIVDVSDCLPSGAIFYSRMWHVNEFFGSIFPHIKREFVFISNEGDPSMPPEHLRYLITEPNTKVIHWFSQNGLAPTMRKANASSRFSLIPIGLNCKEHVDSMNAIRKRYLEKSLPVSGDFHADDPIRVFPHASNESLLLLNFDPNTDPTGSRKDLWERGCSSSAHHAKSWRNFTVCYGKETGVTQYIGSMPDIYERNMKQIFWLSPRGNGLDCHRTWEALYLARIPVMLTSDIDELFEDLPVVIVDNWDKITESFLRQQYALIMNKRRMNAYNFDKLKVSYWRKMILEKSAYSNVAERPASCWNPLNPDVS